MFRRILCPTDFSEPAQRAAGYAVRLAASCGAEVVLLHVVAELAYPMRSLGVVTAYPNLQEELRDSAARELAAARSKLPADAEIETELREGEVHEQVLECARDRGADLVVIGTHGHTGIKHMLLGSTAEKVVRLSDCPVLTVRAPT